MTCHICKKEITTKDSFVVIDGYSVCPHHEGVKELAPVGSLPKETDGGE